MGNRVELVGTTFINTTGKQTYGFLIYDDYESAFCNQLDAPVEDDFELLRQAILHETPQSEGLLATASSGCCINGTWYDGDEIEHVFNSASDAADDQAAAQENQQLSKAVAELKSAAVAALASRDAWKQACRKICAFTLKEGEHGKMISLLPHGAHNEITRLLVNAEVLEPSGHTLDVLNKINVSSEDDCRVKIDVRATY